MVQVGTAGNDTLQGYATADTISGAGGNDTIYGHDGNDTLNGDAGNDTLHGHNGNDTLNGGAGDDRLYGDSGNDTLRGGTGSDYLEGGGGNDTYLFSRGDGNTTIKNHDTGANRQDILSFMAGIAPGDVTVRRPAAWWQGHLILTVKNTGEGADEVITVRDYFNGDGAGGYALNEIRFADGTSWDIARIKAMVQAGTVGNDTLHGYTTADTISGAGGNDTIYDHGGNDTLNGDAGNDTLWGGSGNDTLNGGAGTDTLRGESGNDTLNGGANNDTLYGGSGNDTLRGGSGNDHLQGDGGSDTYVFNTGFGADTIHNHDTQAGSVDIAQFSGVSIENLWFSRSGNNLQINVAGSDDQVTINHWYTNSGYQLDSIKAGTSVLLNNKVDQLVSAMASYSVPSGVGTVIPEATMNSLRPVITAAWQASAS